MTPTTAAPNRAVVTVQGEREVRIERLLAAPREKVWRALTEPALIAQWWGRGNRMDIPTFELARGGHWRYVEHSDHGSHGFEGRFREVTPPSRIERTFEWDGMPGHVAVETITLEDLGDGRTRMVSTSLFMTGQDRDGMVQSGMESGVQQSYAALDRVLDTL